MSGSRHLSSIMFASEEATPTSAGSTKQSHRHSSARATKTSEIGVSAQNAGGNVNPQRSSSLSPSVSVASPSNIHISPSNYPTMSPTFIWPATSSTSTPASQLQLDTISNTSESSNFPTSAPSVKEKTLSQGVLRNGTVETQTPQQGISTRIWLPSIFISVTALTVALITLIFFFVWRRRRAVYWREFASIKADFSTDLSKAVQSDVDVTTANIGSIQYVDVSPDFELQSRTPSYTFSDYWESKRSVADDTCCQDQGKTYSVHWESSTIATRSSRVHSDCDTDSAEKKTYLDSAAFKNDKKSEVYLEQKILPSTDFGKLKNLSIGDTRNAHGETSTDQWESSTIASMEDFSLTDCVKK